MSSNELKDRILKSSAWQSLRQEQQVARVLTGLEWSVVHSAFYTDAETRKFREVDVIARQSWARAYRGQKIYGQVFAVVECKSATGYHILVSPMHEREDIIAHRMWIGEEDKYYAQVANALKESALTEEHSARVMRLFRKHAYPMGTWRTASMVIGPLRSDWHAGAFREHNIGGEKELDNSVVWKAQMALSSAFRAFEESNVALALADLPTEIEVARQCGENPADAAANHLFVSLDFVYLYHPIVVIDTPIWAIVRDQPKLIEWCRLYRQDAFGHSDWWFDLVEADKFEVYARSLSAHYKKEFRRVGAVLTITIRAKADRIGSGSM